MAVKKKKVEHIEIQGAIIEKIEKPKTVKPKVIKPKFKTKNYELIVDVPIGDTVVKKGTKYPLTDKGAKYFKSKFYIK